MWGLQNIDWSAQIADVMRNQFGLKPKELIFMFRKPYPEAYNQTAMPNRYRVPDFTKFFGQDNMSTVEHVTISWPIVEKLPRVMH